ncbi:hypothetical protein ACTJIJ_22410 [Niabella sp. 22666]|uniref:hypothetical protein n=1 Tax=Niabella sp. 22666 TaxID=3453954 RepID=UPI003F84ED2F
MRKNAVLTVFILITNLLKAQTSGSFTVGGSFDNYYPVTFYDGGLDNNAPTELILGRSNIHENSTWRGSMIARFYYHTFDWGNLAHFIDAKIHNSIATAVLIGGWQDVSTSNPDKRIIIWLKGGGTTYHYKASDAVNPVVYDGAANSLPLTIANTGSFNAKTTADVFGDNISSDQHFLGNVGIGTHNLTEKLSVNGKIRAKEIKVESDPWPDYVFKKDYKLPSLAEVEKHIKEKGHLPEVPSAEEVEKEGIALGANQAVLLKKIEELTLYMIDMQKLMEKLAKDNEDQAREIRMLKSKTGNRK